MLLFSDILVIMGKATKSHRTYFMKIMIQNDQSKYRWIIQNDTLNEVNQKTTKSAS
jgi:hypothetical protein